MDKYRPFVEYSGNTQRFIQHAALLHKTQIRKQRGTRLYQEFRLIRAD